MPSPARGASPAPGSAPPREDDPPGASRGPERTARTRSPVGPACYTERVPRVAPFHGLRFDPAVAGSIDLLTAPPYDVISGPNRDGLAARSRYNIVHVDVADEDRVDAPATGYERAASLLERWTSEGALVRGGEPTYYGYEARFRLGGVDRRLRGVVCALELEPW